MTHFTIHSTEIPFSASNLDFFRPLFRFFGGGIRDLNRYLDAASLVHPAGSQNPDPTREQSWEGWL
jgi:hypothetical protein